MSDSKGNRVPHVLGGQQAAELVESRDLLRGGYRKAGATLKQQLCRDVQVKQF